MKTAIVSVGTELLMGQTVNTNTVFLSQQLNLLGHDVLYHYTAGDNPRRLKELMELAFRDCDLILTTGGLGPTQDDLTKEIACQVLSDELVVHQESLEDLEAAFKRMNRPMTSNNLKQAYMPSRAVVFKNDQGTAPGFALEKDGKYVVCMPGPPREMTAMYEGKVRPFLESKSDGFLVFRDVRTYGIGESQLETTLMDLIDGQKDPTLATYAKEGECLLRIASKRSTREEAQVAVDEMVENVREHVGDFIYSVEGEDLPQVVGNLLLEKKLSLSAAESCTGGLFASSIIDVPGISASFDRGLVTYSNRSKVEELGVRQETLDAFGAVSEETAREMAEGLFRVTRSDVCIAVTGIAGPDGGTPQKPVGLVYIALCFAGETTCKKILMRNVSRGWNRNYAMLAMMDMIYRRIK
ncbi:MAG: competence/damage-inducible protein A [Anaerovoracaceae bacterium]|jgi:nicotinamide-nucleotide amidase